MKVLVVGSGGREHALCWALAKSPLIETLICAPGNGGIEAVAQCVDISADNIAGILEFCRREAVDFVVVGPEAPLVAGLVDRLGEAGIDAFGPSAAAAALEGSKGFTKDLCQANGIATAAYGRFNEARAARDFVAARGAPIVVKADGLAAGKGVIIAQSTAEAEAAIDDILGGRFGQAGAELVVEEFLEGEEVSVFVLVDGENVLEMATAQDHKAVGDGDSGPNTGGMGAFSPAPVMTEALRAQVMAEIIEPTVRAMAAAGTPYKGVLYAGLMITADGPSLLEYNVRFGDPECQVLMARLESDLLPALLACARGTLAGVALEWKPEAALDVVLAANGYPGTYKKGSEIRNIEAAEAMNGVTVFHAGTKRQDGKVLASGGRVLAVTALGADVTEAQAKAYQGVDAIDWPQGFCRRDIGWRALAKN